MYGRLNSQILRKIKIKFNFKDLDQYADKAIFHITSRLRYWLIRRDVPLQKIQEGNSVVYLHAEANGEKTGYCKLLWDVENRLAGYRKWT